MSFIRFRKGMTLKEFEEMVAAGETPKAPTLKAKPKLVKPRRSREEIEAAGRYPNGRVRPRSRIGKPPRAKKVKGVVPQPKKTKPDVDSMRVVWFVDAKRNKTEVSLAMPYGEREALRCSAILIGYGWTAEAVCRSTYRNDPRFFQLDPERG